MTDVRRREAKEYGNIGNAVTYFQRFAIPKDKRILDIGTNLGTLPNELHALGYADVHGIDVRESAIEHGKQQYPAIRENLRSYDGHIIPYADESIDVVTMFDVIEHIPDISTFMLEVNRVLVKGGHFIFQTPNIYINSVWATIVWRSLEWKRDHCSLQSLSSLHRLLRSAGFTHVVVDKFSIDTEFNRTEARKYLGPAGALLLKLSDQLPLTLFPNFYGSALKP